MKGATGCFISSSDHHGVCVYLSTERKVCNKEHGDNIIPFDMHLAPFWSLVEDLETACLVQF